GLFQRLSFDEHHIVGKCSGGAKQDKQSKNRPPHRFMAFGVYSAYPCALAVQQQANSSVPVKPQARKTRKPASHPLCSTSAPIPTPDTTVLMYPKNPVRPTAAAAARFVAMFAAAAPMRLCGPYTKKPAMQSSVALVRRVWLGSSQNNSSEMVHMSM